MVFSDVGVDAVVVLLSVTYLSQGRAYCTGKLDACARVHIIQRYDSQL